MEAKEYLPNETEAVDSPITRNYVKLAEYGKRVSSVCRYWRNENRSVAIRIPDHPQATRAEKELKKKLKYALLLALETLRIRPLVFIWV